MTTIRPARVQDVFEFNNINLDPYTETYNMTFYMHYLATWPEYFFCAVDPNGRIMGYIMGKSEGRGTNWHGHVTALTVAPEYRRLGVAQKLMEHLEFVSEHKDKAYFVDLYVRVTNQVAIDMYKKFGYVVYRRVLDYYSGEEDAFDMRRSLSRDPERKAMIPLDHPVHASEVS
eukprot:c45544_g1_i1.p1 GENE.c45544_g1_i1~~c45544_g1_i1.p1  ORF type:complete len:173 (+),score=42.89 c45544_g1_i1:525-1043(+)